MAEAIGQVLSFAVGVALSPAAIVAMVLMLGTPRARSNGPAFVAGWLIALSAVGAIVLVVSGGAGATDADGPATWVSVLKLVAGVLLLGVALEEWRKRPSGGDDARDMPGWMRTIDRFTPQRSLAMGVALAAINPKNLLLTLGAAAAIAQTGVGSGDQIAALAVFVVLATAGPGVPLLVYFVAGEQAERILDRLKTRMSRNNAAIMAVLCLVIGAKLIGDAISAL